MLDGQKVWSSYAHVADFCILLARSDPGSQRHDGLTYVIVDMHAPGVEVRPLRQITGDAEFNEIFLTGVEVPRENLLGEIGGGWQVAMTTLLHERGTLGVALVSRLEVAVRKLLELARHRGATPLQRDAIAREWIELEALRLTAYRSLSALARTGIPGPEGSILKLQWSEANQRLTALALDILGPEAQLTGERAPYAGWWAQQQLRSRGNTIEAGTSEIPTPPRTISTAPSPITATRSSSSRSLRSPISTAATRITPRRTTTAPSPISTQRSRSTPMTSSPSTTADLPSPPRASSPAPSPITRRQSASIRASPRSSPTVPARIATGATTIAPSPISRT